MSEVAADGLDLGGQDDLMLVGDGLRVVALQKAAQAFDDTGVRVGEVDATFRGGRRLERIRWSPEAPAVLIRPRAR
jgi:hypothetical protein